MVSKKRSREKKAKRRRQKSKKESSHKRFESTPKFLLEYYTRPFQLLHHAHSNSGYDPEVPHPIRQRFWQFVPSREFDLGEARELLHRYLFSLENTLAVIVQESSLAYWLHLYRRLSPGPIGRDKQPQTIGLTRAVLEAAIQKYSRLEICDRIGESKKVPIEKVLSGILSGPDFKDERRFLEEGKNELVLTNFTHVELTEFYDTEKLAYEIWRTSATLRVIGKGAPFVVTKVPEMFHDNRSDDLDELIRIHDERRREIHISAKGVIFEGVNSDESSGFVFIPVYNLKGVKISSFEHIFKELFKKNIIGSFKSNFVWIPFNLKGFREAHLPFAESFEAHHGVSLDAVLCVVSSLLYGVLKLWTEGDNNFFLRCWQRAYEGPDLKTKFRKIIENLFPKGMELLGIQDKQIKSEDLNAAIRFWELTPSKRRDIDLAYSGPHYIFLPYSNDRWFVDYTWILRRLYDLFIGVSIDDQNFKGDALEKVIGRDKSILPTRQCKAYDGSEKQIDCAIPVGEHLVILEAKAVGRSIAYDRGDPRAISYRLDNVVERSLREVDEKAEWLANRPKGLNYDITPYKDIMPIAITPFVEFIPSLDSRYWLTEGLPRVLTPGELHEAIKNNQLISKSMNNIFIGSTC